MNKFKVELNPLKFNSNKEWTESHTKILNANTSLNAGNNYRKQLRKVGLYLNPCDIVVTKLYD